ncbi:MAG: hypothetical protein ACO1OG_06490 [Devosia sp.]
MSSAPRPNELIGLELVTSFLAADMRMFGFGAAVADARGVRGDFSLHLQCPWRIDGPAGLLVSSRDLHIYAGDAPEPEDWDFEAGNSRQSIVLEALLGPRIPLGNGYFHRSGHIVTSADSSSVGDLVIELSSGLTLRVFPIEAGSEQWRLFAPASGRPHLVQGG